MFAFDGSPPAYGMVLAIPPYGRGHVFGHDVSSEAKALLLELESQWEVLWPELLAKIESRTQESEVELEFNADSFYTSVQPLEAGVFMSDQASVMIGVHPTHDAVPAWHFFLEGKEIKHFQPVF